jgi:hypothetical protein
MVRLFDTPKSNPNLFRVNHHQDPITQRAESSSHNTSVSSQQHPPLVELVDQNAAAGSVFERAPARGELKLMTSPLSHQRLAPHSINQQRSSSPQPRTAVNTTLVDLKCLMFDNVAVHVWSTRQNRLLLVDGPDKADIVSQRASVRLLKDSAQLLCGERGVVMEQLRPRDIASVGIHASTNKATFSVAVHAHAPTAADEFDGNSFVRRLPNGVVLRGGNPSFDVSANKRAGSASTWATVVILCPNIELAQRLHDAIEGLRVRYLHSAPHGSVPEAGVAESAIVLQHKAREMIARAGLRPDGVAQQLPTAALIPAAAVKRRGSPAPLSPRSFLMLNSGGATPHSGMSTPPLRSPPWSNKRSQHGSAPPGGGHLSLLTSIPRSPFDPSPSADAYEVLLGSDDDDDGASRSEITFRYDNDGREMNAPSDASSSPSSVVSSDDDEERAAVIRSAFREPFVPLKREIQEILGPRGTWVPPQQGATTMTTGASSTQQKYDVMHSSTISAATAAPLAETSPHKQPPDNEELSNDAIHITSDATAPSDALHRHQHMMSQRSSLSGSSGRLRNAADSDPFLQGSTVRPAAPQPSETERRTQALIDKLRAGIHDAHKQQELEQQHQYQFQHAAAAPLLSSEPTMILDPPQQQQLAATQLPRRSLRNPNTPSPHRDQRPKPLLQVLRRDELDDNNNDASDAESLQFHEEDRNANMDRTAATADPLDNTVVPSKADDARRQRGPTPTKRSSPPRATGSSAAVDGPRLTRATTASGLNKSPNRNAGRSALDEALAGGGRRSSAGRVTSPNSQQRRSPIVASSRFQLNPGSDAATLQQQQQRHRSPTPTMRVPTSTRPSRMVSPDPELSPSREDFGAMEPSLAPQASSASLEPTGSRRCKWCKNVAPESHDDRCALRKIRCRKCQKVLLLKERNSHECDA